MSRIWIYSQKWISLLDIRVKVHLAHFWKVWLFSITSSLAATSFFEKLRRQQPDAASTGALKRAKNSPIFSEMCQMHEFTFYTSTMYEICLYCHCLGFSSVILNFGQRDMVQGVLAFILWFVAPNEMQGSQIVETLFHTA